MQPHQIRVIEEKKDLDIKIAALTAFSTTKSWESVPTAEKSRLSAQLAIMQQYSSILAQRIAAF